jgi:hypothetical protein
MKAPTSALLFIALFGVAITAKSVKLDCSKEDSECMIEWEHMLKQVNTASNCDTTGNCVKLCGSVPVTGFKTSGGYWLKGSVDHDTLNPESHSHKILSVKKTPKIFNFMMKPNKHVHSKSHHDDVHNN